MFNEIILKLAARNCSLSRYEFDALRFICDRGGISTAQIRNYKFDRDHFYQLVARINAKLLFSNIDIKIVKKKIGKTKAYRWEIADAQEE